MVIIVGSNQGGLARRSSNLPIFLHGIYFAGSIAYEGPVGRRVIRKGKGRERKGKGEEREGKGRGDGEANL